jgi:hypothetical protein
VNQGCFFDSPRDRGRNKGLHFTEYIPQLSAVDSAVDYMAPVGPPYIIPQFFVGYVKLITTYAIVQFYRTCTSPVQEIQPRLLFGYTITVLVQYLDLNVARKLEVSRGLLFIKGDSG